MEPHVENPPMEPRKTFPIILATLGAIVVGIAAFFLINSHTRTIVGGLVGDPAGSLSTTDDRTNVLFLGLGGKGHEAPDLTDSIMVASLRHTDHSVTLISIPRDIWVDTLKAKINTAYHYGNEKREGGGKDLSKSAVSEALGIPIHYVIAIDFDGFTKAIDAVGGIDVKVDNAFDDYEYPIPGMENAEPESARYEHLHFDAGLTHMDGSTALKFARSRHAEGDEGTDFARGARQQKIILAFKDKLLATKTFTNKDTITNVISSFQSSIDTDIQEKDYGSFLKYFLVFQQNGEKTNSIAIEELLQNPKNKAPYGGQWVLIPTGTWEDIYAYVQKSLE